MFPHLLLYENFKIIFNNVVNLKLKKYGTFTVLQNRPEKREFRNYNEHDLK